MTDDEISEDGRRARFEKWEKLGVDQVKSDLLSGGHRVVGGPPSVRALAWEWVRKKEAEAKTPLDSSPSEILRALGLDNRLDGARLGEPDTDLDRLVRAARSASTAEVQKLEPAQEEKQAELFMFKPNIHGIGIDLKEAGRRLRRLFGKGES